MTKIEPMIFTYESYIKPYVRMTQKSKFVDPRAQEYLNSKEALAWHFKLTLAEHGWDPIPGQTPFKVEIVLYHTAGHRADLDNILKAILDAGNGIIYPDDRWCRKIIIERLGTKTDSLVFEVMIHDIIG
jgi:Holliday junction resolvase RusA-like endonuclease